MSYISRDKQGASLRVYDYITAIYLQGVYLHTCTVQLNIITRNTIDETVIVTR